MMTAFETFEEETTRNGGEAYLPEGNETNVLREFRFTLDERSLREGLSFPEEEEATLREPFPVFRRST